MSTAVELALDSVIGRATEPVMLDKPLSVDELPTPALVLDRQIMNANIQTMAQHLGKYGKGFRPHAKTHKCPTIARLQMEAGRWESVLPRSARLPSWFAPVLNAY